MAQACEFLCAVSPEDASSNLVSSTFFHFIEWKQGDCLKTSLEKQTELDPGQFLSMK